MIEDNIKNLYSYIERDELYQKWKKGELQGENISDFEYFCIKHCEDIEKLIEYNKELIELCEKYEKEHNTVFKMWLKEIDKYTQKEQV